MKLYVTGASPNSIRGIENIRQFCERYLKGAYTLEVIDIHQQPERAKEEQLIALPLLVKKLPLPERKLVGDFSDTEKVIRVLGLEP